MIIVKLQGGLGNQMFQYAFGKAMSVKLSKPLYFDYTYFDNQYKADIAARNYELALFSFTIDAADSKTTGGFIKPKTTQRLLNKLNIYTKTFYKEGSLKFDNRIFNLSTPIYLDGYWQSEKYFQNIAGQIRKDFVFKKPLNKLSELISHNLLSEDNSVGVHIRRGDYISSAQNSQVHGSCPVNYYKQSIDILNDKLSKPRYYFFSDEPEWVEQNLISDLTDFEIVEHNKETDSWQDMYLMSQCKHHIIANSSFSWWGAWLNPSPDKIVIAPSNWFALPDLNRQSETIVPENWIRI